MKTIDRNVFQFHPEYFPAVERSDVAAARVVEDEMFWDRLAKSTAARADQKKQRQIRIQNLQVAAGKLRLQTTIMGSVPRALIDGRMTRIGEQVEAPFGGSGATVLVFRVTQIEPRRVVIEREGVKLELSMGETGNARVLSDNE